MKEVFDIIQKAFQENLIAVILLIIVTAIFYLLNIVFGTILGSNEVGFDLKKFLFGFLKGIVASLGILAYCFGLNLLSLTLSLVNINVSVEVITVLETIGVLFTWDIDLAKEIFDKVKALKELKYVSYKDITVNDYSVDERG